MLELILLFLSTAEYHTSTIYCTSKVFYKNTICVVHKVLKGSSLAPTIWLAVSTLLAEIDVNKFLTKGSPNPTTIDSITKIIDAFVEDSYLWDVLYDIRLSSEDQ